MFPASGRLTMNHGCGTSDSLSLLSSPHSPCHRTVACQPLSKAKLSKWNAQPSLIRIKNSYEPSATDPCGSQITVHFLFVVLSFHFAHYTYHTFFFIFRPSKVYSRLVCMGTNISSSYFPLTIDEPEEAEMKAYVVKMELRQSMVFLCFNYGTRRDQWSFFKTKLL